MGRADPINLQHRIAEIREAYNQCFGCGLDNGIGLRIDGFEIADGELSARFSPRPQFAGFAGMLHGGIVATLLDETLAWTAMLIEHTYVVTASLELKYRKPAPVGVAYESRGRVVERRGKRMRLAGEAYTAGRLIASAQGLFLATESPGAQRDQSHRTAP